MISVFKRSLEKNRVIIQKSSLPLAQILKNVKKRNTI
jgi:hypothetical protein